MYRWVQGGDIPHMGHRVPFVYHLALLCKTGQNRSSIKKKKKHLETSVDLLSQIDHGKRFSVKPSSGLLLWVPNVSYFYFLQ